MKSSKQQLKLRRKARIRAKISGTPERPRLSVHRGLSTMYAQLIDDTTGTTIVSAYSKEIDKAGKKKVDVAAALGTLIAQKAQKAGVAAVVFDRGGNAYHGRVKSLGEAARSEGLNF